MSDSVEILEVGPLAAVVQSFALRSTDEEPEITEIFIADDGKIISSKDLLKSALRYSMRGIPSDRIYRENNLTAIEDVRKSIEGSTQSRLELNENPPGSTKMKLGDYQIVEPPYPPEVLAAFLEVDSVHFRCCSVKTTDAVGRDYTLEPVQLPDGTPFDSEKQTDAHKTQIAEEIRLIRRFVKDCNPIHGFDGTLTKVWLDYESIGWGAIEVIRSRDMRVRRIVHVPAPRIRVLRGWKGFVELVGPNKFIYYQNFGEKILSSREDPLTGDKETYNPLDDGNLDSSGLEWSFIDRDTGEPTSSFERAANELIWIPKLHNNTVYYGLTDAQPALGDILANVHIRDYTLQFFEHNTVPRYAVIIEGAKMADPVKELIMEYFNTHVKGKPHKTLIIPIPALRGEVKVRFERLDAEEHEGSYQETKKNNAQGIMTAHGVSPAIIGIAEHSELGSGKGLSQAEIYKDL